MPTPPETNKTYVCPKCGQTAQIGAHFCQPFVPPPPPPRPRPKQTGNRMMLTVLASVMVVILLWRWLGPASLAVVALGLLAVLFFAQPRTGKGNQAKHPASSPGSELENKTRSTDSKSDSKTPSSPGKSKR